MATYTTNLDLKKPAQSDKIRIADINGNMDEIDAAFGAVGETSVATQLGDIRGGMAIVSNGDTHDAIAAGQFVYVMNHSTLDDGLYTADSALAANASLTSSNLTAVSGGGLNALNSKLSGLQLVKIDKTISIPDGTQTEQNVTVDLSNFIPSGKVIHSFSEARLDKYALPYISGSQITRLSEVNNTSIVIKSNSTQWNNYIFHIALFIA